jgi:hypothetical protein
MGSPLRAFQRYAVSAWNKRRVTLSNPEPIVSFTFDDFPRSALTIGGSIVESYGARVFRSGLFGQLSEFNHAAAPMASKS